MLKVYPTVCIVGNGGSLKNKLLGLVIDRHNIVVRCNFYEIAGYEKDVGTRTTHWLLWLARSKAKISARSDCSKLKEVWIRKYQTETVLLNNVKSSKFIDESVMIEPINATPTTGMLGICYAIMNFKCPINVVGFGLSDKIEKTHYESGQLPFNGHDLEFERLLINKFVCQGLVRRLDEDNSSLS